MAKIKKLHLPLNLENALRLMKSHPEAKLIAGGTDLLVKIRGQATGRESLDLISLRKLNELSVVAELPGGEITIGPMNTFSGLVENKIIRKHLPLLVQAAESMGGPQIRNMATIGGNICNGATSGDSAPSLFCLDAKLKLEKTSSSRMLDIDKFYLGPSKVDLQPGEILTSILIPAKEKGRFGSWYTKFSSRKAMDISIMSCAVTCTLNNDSSIGKASIAMGTAAPTPVRCLEAEKILLGQKLSVELLQQCANKAILSIRPRSSWRASAEYRMFLAEALVMETVEKAYERAKGKKL